MAKFGKRTTAARAAFAGKSAMAVEAALTLIKSSASAKFDETLEIAMNLGVDPRHADQMVRGVVTLPHGTGKDVRVLALVTPDKEAEAKEAGADHIGLDEYLQKIKDGWTDIDVIVTMPSVMGKLGPLGRILGPRGLMPNPKTGTVSDDTAHAVNESKAGRVEFRADKGGAAHMPLGKVSFEIPKLVENAETAINAIIKARPAATKGNYVLSCTISATMSPGVKIDLKDILKV